MLLSCGKLQGERDEDDGIGLLTRRDACKQSKKILPKWEDY
jgi:hypothetical protein